MASCYGANNSSLGGKYHHFGVNSARDLLSWTCLCELQQLLVLIHVHVYCTLDQGIAFRVLRRPYDNGCNDQPDNKEVAAKENILFLARAWERVWRNRPSQAAAAVTALPAV